MSDALMQEAAMRMQNAAYVMSQVTCALCEALGMAADNQQRSFQGDAVAYNHEAFSELLTTYGIHHNGVMEALQRGL
jgi:hypothetical protein